MSRGVCVETLKSISDIPADVVPTRTIRSGGVELTWRVAMKHFVRCYEHQYVLGLPSGRIWHVNGDKLDNRVDNLRLEAWRTRDEHFWARVDRTDDDTCWLWTGPSLPSGYGLIFWRNGGVRFQGYSHRVSWEIARGPIPDGLFVCHACDNTKCVNPKHLFLGTHQDNMHDMVAKGRHKTCGNFRRRAADAHV